jgi:hypothetical protein
MAVDFHECQKILYYIKLYKSPFFCSQWAYVIMRYLSSIRRHNSKARFVTAGAIDMKLCTYVPLGQMTWQTKFWPDLILGLATRGPKPKAQQEDMVKMS